jgi:hypothetical protein
VKSVIVWSFTLNSINRGLFSGEFCLASGLHVHEPSFMTGCEPFYCCFVVLLFCCYCLVLLRFSMDAEVSEVSEMFSSFLMVNLANGLMICFADFSMMTKIQTTII